MSKEILITRGQIVIVDEQDYEELSKHISNPDCDSNNIDIYILHEGDCNLITIRF